MMYRIAAAAALAGWAAIAVAQPAPTEIPAGQPAAEEQQRLAAARSLLSAMWPADTMEPLMREAIAQGVREGQAEDAESARQDPHYSERSRLVEEAIVEEVMRVFRDLGPDIQSLMAEAYARHLSADELQQAAAFLTSPSGRRFMASAWDAEADPDYLREIEALEPTFEEMGRVIERRFNSATAHLPRIGGAEGRGGNKAPGPLAAIPPRPAPPSSAQGTADPERLAAARRAAAAVWPAEFFQQRLDVVPVVDTLLALRIRELGIPLPESLGINPDDTFGALVIREDPHFRERMRIGLGVAGEEVMRTGAAIRPELIRILGDLYARRFTLTELSDIERFFGSPAGRRFTLQTLPMFQDPALWRGFVLLLPRVAMQVPALIQRVSAATAHLPPPPPRLETPPSGGQRQRRPRRVAAVQAPLSLGG